MVEINAPNESIHSNRFSSLDKQKARERGSEKKRKFIALQAQYNEMWFSWEKE